jgi:hypothetical protein
MSDDSGVMGNLPRSRPGRRSAKRGAPGAEGGAVSARAAAGARKAGGAGAGAKSKSKAKAGAGAKRSKPRAAAAPRAGAAKARAKSTPHAASSKARAGAAPRASSSPPPRVERERSGGSAGRDPVTQVVHAAGAVAGAGLKVAAGIVRRLPRP